MIDGHDLLLALLQKSVVLALPRAAAGFARQPIVGSVFLVTNLRMAGRPRMPQVVISVRLASPPRTPKEHAMREPLSGLWTLLTSNRTSTLHVTVRECASAVLLSRIVIDPTSHQFRYSMMKLQ